MSPRRLADPCPVPGCPRLKAPGWPRCERHTRTQTREFNQRRDPAVESTYHSPLWQRLTRRVKAEEPTCQGWPHGSGCGKPTTDVDHIRAMRDGGERYDRANLRAMCHACHARKSGDERRARGRVAVGAKVLVCGPPCSGKSTFVRDHAPSDARVLDWDDLYEELSGLPRYERRVGFDELVTEAFYQRVAEAVRLSSSVWIIAGAPRRWQRLRFRRQGVSRVVVLEVAPALCIRRARKERPSSWVPGVRRWWSEYEPDSHDERWTWRGGLVRVTTAAS